MSKEPKPIGDRRLNPLTGSETNRVVFGYLRLSLGVVHAVDIRGRPDEARLIGAYRGGTGDPEPPLGRIADEAVIIRGQPHPISAGQTDARTGKRKDGVVVIDASNLKDRA